MFGMNVYLIEAYKLRGDIITSKLSFEVKGQIYSFGHDFSSSYPSGVKVKVFTGSNIMANAKVCDLTYIFDLWP